MQTDIVTASRAREQNNVFYSDQENNLFPKSVVKGRERKESGRKPVKMQPQKVFGGKLSLGKLSFTLL